MITVMVGQQFETEKLANMLAGEMRNPEIAFDFITQLELAVADENLCRWLADHFSKVAEELEE